MISFSTEKTYALFATPFSKKLIAELETKNIEHFVFPTITTKEFEDLDAILPNLFEFDWLIFHDVYTVEYFVDALEKSNIDLFELDNLRVLAFGETVADRLRFSQLHADVIPSTTKISDVLQALNDYIFEDFADLSFLILKAKNVEIELKNHFSNFTEIQIYSVEIADENQIPKLKALLKGGAIDEFIFSSHYDVLNLAQMFQTENLTDLLEGINLTAADNLTLQSLQEFRLVEK